MNNKLNYKKQEMYTVSLSKLNKALHLGFSYEAIMLEYALIEDRLTEMLLVIGMVSKGNPKPVVSKKIKSSVRKLLNLKENSKFGINKISVKIDLLKKLSEYCCSDDEYLAEAASYLNKKVGITELSDCLDEVIEWKEKRNGFVHGLMDKVPREAEPELELLASEGIILFRLLDKYCKRMKNCNLRKKYHINPINWK